MRRLLATSIWTTILAASQCLIPHPVQAQFAYETNNGAITIVYYAGTNAAVTIPDRINGLPVTRIGYEAFCRNQKVRSITIPDSVTVIEDGGWFTDMVYGDYHGAFFRCDLTNVTLGTNLTSIGNLAFSGCLGLTNITLPASIRAIGGGSRLDRVLERVVYLGAFTDCANLTGLYCGGDRPFDDGYVLKGDDKVTVYYLPAKSGWNATFGSRPTAPWLPQIQSIRGAFGAPSNQVGFNIAWANGQTVVLEACASPVNPVWSALQTNTIGTSPLFYWDPGSTNIPSRFYRVHSQ